MGVLDCSKNGFNCNKTILSQATQISALQTQVHKLELQVRDKDRIISYISKFLDLFINHDSSVYGLKNPKDVGLKCNESDIQQIWTSLGVKQGTPAQISLGRAQYRMSIEDMKQFLARCPVHTFIGVTAQFDCSDFSLDMFGQCAMALWATQNREWYNVVFGMCHGTQKFIGGDGKPTTGGHFWNWFWPKDDTMPWIVDYLVPVDRKYTPIIDLPTKIYRYNPDIHGKPDRVYW